jgi:hypothetical protein
MEYYRNMQGNRGFIVSPNYGLGWYTYNGDTFPDCATDPTLVEMVAEYQRIRNQPNLTYSERNERGRLHPDLLEQQEKIKAYANSKWPGGSWVVDNLQVEWVSDGPCVVTYTVYDGAETATVMPIDRDSHTLMLL